MFFPIKDENPTVNKPYVTVTLIAVNVLVYLYTFPMGTQAFNIFMYKFGLIPYELVHIEELTPRFAVPIFLTPFTSMFLHGGFLHLAGNMLFLWIFGNNIEDFLGPVKFIIFYLASGLAAVALFVIFGPNSQIPLVGASGAIAGILGAYLILFPHARIVALIVFFFIQVVRVPAKIMLGFWFFYQLLMSLMGGGGGVAWLAHVGGFAFGWVWFRYIAGRRQRKWKKQIMG